MKGTGSILHSDSLGMAIECMYNIRSSKAYVISANGDLKGVVSIVDICKELIKQENRFKMTKHQDTR